MLKGQPMTQPGNEEARDKLLDDLLDKLETEGIVFLFSADGRTASPYLSLAQMQWWDDEVMERTIVKVGAVLKLLHNAGVSVFEDPVKGKPRLHDD